MRDSHESSPGETASGAVDETVFDCGRNGVRLRMKRCSFVDEMVFGGRNGVRLWTKLCSFADETVFVCGLNGVRL